LLHLDPYACAASQAKRALAHAPECSGVEWRAVSCE